MSSTMTGQSIEKRTAIYEVMKDKWPHMISFEPGYEDEFKFSLQCLATDEQRTEMYNAIKDKIPDILKTDYKLLDGNALQYLTSDQQAEIIGIKKLMDDLGKTASPADITAFASALMSNDNARIKTQFDLLLKNTNPREALITALSNLEPVWLGKLLFQELNKESCDISLIEKWLAACPSCCSLKDDSFKTPLHYLVKNRNMSSELLELVCRNISQETLNGYDKDFNTPLHIAFKEKQLNEQNIQLLLQYGANPTIFDKHNRDVFSYLSARQEPDLIDALYKRKNEQDYLATTNLLPTLPELKSRHSSSDELAQNMYSSNESENTHESTNAPRPLYAFILDTLYEIMSLLCRLFEYAFPPESTPTSTPK